MNNKGLDFNLGMVFLLIAGIIIALAILPQIAVNTGLMTTKNNIERETQSVAAAMVNPGHVNASYEFTITNAPTGWKTTNCPITGFKFGNLTKNFTVTTDYTFTESTGVFKLVNSTAVLNFDTQGNTSYVSYQYCLDGYIPDQGARAIAGLIVLLCGLGIVGFTIYYFYKNMKDSL